MTKGIELGCDEKIRQSSAAILHVAYKNYSSQLDEELQRKIIDHQKIAMPQGGSALLHMAAQSLNKVVAAKNQTNARVNGLELILALCAIEPTEEVYQKSLIEINRLLQHSKSNGNYLDNDDNEYNLAKVTKIRDGIVFAAKSNNPSFSATPLGASAKKEGCFIATAATGDYDHPKVVILREFRDNFLLPRNWGRTLVSAYYKSSPTIANFISANPQIKPAVVALIANPAAKIAKLI